MYDKNVRSERILTKLYTHINLGMY